MVVSQGDTDAQARASEFQPTFWTVVLRARDAEAPDRREALERLIQSYWKPVYALVRRRHDLESAKDLTQAFFTAFLERDFLQYVDRERGRFRTFLRVALEHFLSDESDRAKALKRGGGRAPLSLDFMKAETQFKLEPASPETPERAFQKGWAIEVIKRALEKLRAEFENSDRSAEFEGLSFYLSAGGATAPTYQELADRLNVSESVVTNRIHQVRRRYRELILDEIRAYTASEEDAREELSDLFSAFS